MKRNFKIYAVLWAICVVLFHAIIFIVPLERTQNFRIGYAFITLAFFGQLGCTYLASKAEKLQKVFYNIPVISISCTGLIVMLVAGSVCMAVAGIPNWLGILMCLIVLGVTAISVTGAGAAADIVDRTDKKASAQCEFIRNLAVDAENLMHRAGAPMLKDYCKRVYDAVRYSDPVSNNALHPVEQRITEEFNVLTDAILADDLDCTESASKELLALIAQRNSQCKTLKRKGVNQL